VDAVDEMRAHIAFRVKDGDTFGLSFEGEDAKRVQMVTARLAEVLMRENAKSNTEQVEVTKDFLDTEKQRVEAELKERETALAKFLAKHPEFARETAMAAGGAGTAIRAAAAKGPAPKSADATLQALEREAGRIQERLGMPTQKRRAKGEADVDPKLIAEKAAAEADLSQAQKELADKLAQFTEQHPDVRAAKSRVKTAEARLKRAADAVSAGVAATHKDPEDEGTIDRPTLEAELKKLNDEIAAHKAKKKRDGAAGEAAAAGTYSASIVALETDWTRLNREVAEARERNQQLQTKQFNASMAESAAASGRNAQMVIVDPAYKPTHPAKASRSVVAGIGVGVSMLLGLLLALGCALLDDRIYDRVDLERLALAPLLGAVPKAPKRKRGSLG
ncbi:MAG TPA: hypothetical protein VMZ28_27735, partial [Kofleriaceae bacterium]|nr:hypothetical protein [Kofleriaceae bacterium]